MQTRLVRGCFTNPMHKTHYHRLVIKRLWSGSVLRRRAAAMCACRDSASGSGCASLSSSACAAACSGLPYSGGHHGCLRSTTWLSSRIPGMLQLHDCSLLLPLPTCPFFPNILLRLTRCSPCPIGHLRSTTWPLRLLTTHLQFSPTKRRQLAQGPPGGSGWVQVSSWATSSARQALWAQNVHQPQSSCAHAHAARSVLMRGPGTPRGTCAVH